MSRSYPMILPKYIYWCLVNWKFYGRICSNNLHQKIMLFVKNKIKFMWCLNILTLIAPGTNFMSKFKYIFLFQFIVGNLADLVPVSPPQQTMRSTPSLPTIEIFLKAITLAQARLMKHVSIIQSLINYLLSLHFLDLVTKQYEDSLTSIVPL